MWNTREGDVPFAWEGRYTDKRQRREHRRGSEPRCSTLGQCFWFLPGLISRAVRCACLPARPPACHVDAQNALPPLASSPHRNQLSFGSSDTDDGNRGADADNSSAPPSVGSFKDFVGDGRDSSLKTAAGGGAKAGKQHAAPGEPRRASASDRGVGVSPKTVIGMTPPMSSPAGGCSEVRSIRAWLRPDGVSPTMSLDPADRLEVGVADAASPPLHRGEGEADDESALRLFLGWVQRRQRECVTIISLGCVTVLAANQLKRGTGLGDVAVAAIPVTVHLLMLWDAWQRWQR